MVVKTCLFECTGFRLPQVRLEQESSCDENIFSEIIHRNVKQFRYGLRTPTEKIL